MRKLLQAISFLILVAAVPSVLLLSVEKSSAQQCSITALKVAPGAEGQVFEFLVLDESDMVTAEFEIVAGETESGVFSGSNTVFEIPAPGWRFGGIECEPGGGIEITEVTDTGWSETCVNPNLETFCTITNVRDTASIPTLSEWGMIAAAVGLAMIGVFFAVRRRMAVNS